MVQPSQQWLPASGDMSWLSILVDRFEQVSQADLRAVRCDEHVLAAFAAKLAEPVSPWGNRSRVLN
jgi:hypothetical protein